MFLISAYLWKYVRKLGHYNHSTEVRKRYFLTEIILAKEQTTKKLLKRRRKRPGLEDRTHCRLSQKNSAGKRAALGKSWWKGSLREPHLQENELFPTLSRV